MSDDEYSALRQRNIEERKAVFADFFKDLKQLKAEEAELQKPLPDVENTENEPPRKRRRTISSENDSFRSRRVRLDFRKKYNTRSRARRSSGDASNDFDNHEMTDKPKSNQPKLRVLFPWAKPIQRSIDLMKMGVCDVDEEDEEEGQNSDNDAFDELTNNKRTYKIAKAPYDPDNIPSVDEITQDMLDNIAERSTLKVYCKVNGTSCHQCRQKTLDTKTVCRSGECIGIRGQFCGPCLRGRYGENAVEALQDPNWACPPCRGLCNCSICRTRNGLAPTGILAPIVQEEGYSSVMAYLQTNEDEDT